MIASEEVTYLMNLTALDATTASFGYDQHDAEFQMPVDMWIEMGRPGSIEATAKREVR